MADVYSNLPDGTLSDGWEVHTVNGKEVFRAELSTGGLTGRYALSKIIYDVDPTTGNYTAWQKRDLFDGSPNENNIVYTYDAAKNTFNKAKYQNITFNELSENNNAGLNNLGGQIKSATTKNLSRITSSTNPDVSSSTKNEAAQQTQNLETTKGYQSTVTAQQLNQANQASFNGVPITQEELNKAFAGKGVRENYDLNLRYPEDMTPQQDTLKISVLKYRPRQFSASQGSFGFQDRAPGDVIGSATLYIPGGISDNNRVTFGDGKMNAMEAIMGELAYKAIMTPSETTQTVRGGLNALQNALPDAKRGLASFFTEAATGATGFLQRTEGVVTNPNLELLFNAPTLRPFTFNYRMSPRTPGESTMIKKIIRMFKQSMSVQRTESNLFLKTPNTYKLQFMSGIKEGETEHEFLPKIKECALLSFNVNYTPDGTYSTMYNSSMAAYELSFEFQELEPIYNDDYGNDDTSIGF